MYINDLVYCKLKKSHKNRLPKHCKSTKKRRAVPLARWGHSMQEVVLYWVSDNGQNLSGQPRAAVILIEKNGVQKDEELEKPSVGIRSSSRDIWKNKDQIVKSLEYQGRVFKLYSGKFTKQEHDFELFGEDWPHVRGGEGLGRGESRQGASCNLHSPNQLVR